MGALLGDVPLARRAGARTVPCVVLFDPVHPYATAIVREAYERWGLRTVALISRPSERRFREADGPLLTGPAVAARYRIDPADSLCPSDLAAALAARHRVVAVVPVLEADVVPAARLAAALRLDDPGTEMAALFRDKYALKHRVRSADPTVRMNASSRVDTMADVRSFLADAPFDEVVLKPNDGTGNSRIAFVHRDDPDDAIAAYFAAHPGTDVVCEERIHGDEYCVNGQVARDGKVLVLSIFRTHHVAANGRGNLARAFETVPTSEPMFDLCAEYAADVLTATGLCARPFHMELLVDDTGPCLVEVAARLGGAGMAVDTARAHGGSVDLFALALRDATGLPLDADDTPDWRAYDATVLRTVLGISRRSGRLLDLRGIADVERLPEFSRWVHRPRPGERVAPTVDLFTSPWQVTLVAPAGARVDGADAVDRAEAEVRRVLRWDVDAAQDVPLRAWAADVQRIGRRTRALSARLVEPTPPLLDTEGEVAVVRWELGEGARAVATRVGYAGPVRRTVVGSRSLTALSRRFVSGETTADAVAAARRLAAAGFRTSLNERRAPVTTTDAAAEQRDAYLALVDDLVAAGATASSEVSVKLEQLGLHLPAGESLARDNLATLCARAQASAVAVTVDMESRDEVETTLGIAADVRSVFPELGVAVQAYLARTQDDCRRLAAAGARVRLCKGGYHARGKGVLTGRDIDVAYVRCLELLMRGGAYPMVATHDPRLITIAHTMASRHGLGTGGLEYQMLLGIRPDEQDRLRRAGDTVRVYVPYGPEWYAWFVHRMVERPANLRLAARTLLTPVGP